MTDKVQWKTLPTKANREMEQAGAEAAREYLERNGHNNLWVIYEAMTAAAPQPPTMCIDNVANVPRELTSEMREAFHEANERYEDGVGESPDSQWRAMLRAAPKIAEAQSASAERSAPVECAICRDLGDQCMECEEADFVTWADRHFAAADYRKTAAGVYIQDWMRHSFAAWQARGNLERKP